jgi:hypothetical protein
LEAADGGRTPGDALLPSTPDSAAPPPVAPSTIDAGADSGECRSTGLPDTLQLIVSGFTTCTCLNGAFTLTRANPNESIWSTPQIDGCPGQTTPAFLKLSARGFALGVTDDASAPGSGRSNLSRSESVICSPFAVQGEGSAAGSIGGFCSAAGEAAKMKWQVTE